MEPKDKQRAGQRFDMKIYNLKNIIRWLLSRNMQINCEIVQFQFTCQIHKSIS